MPNKVRDIVDDINSYIYNPVAIFERVLDTARSVVIDGENLDFAEPSGPLPFLLEGAISVTTAAIENDEACCRRSYPAMATELDELYGHMSDEDYYDRFGIPAPETFTMIIGLQELKNRAVPPNGSGIRRLVIPRETEWKVGGYSFSIQYPIELRVMPHGAVQVLYDTSERSPIRDLSNNTLDWTVNTINFGGVGLEYLVIQIPTMQYTTKSSTVAITSGIAFNENIGFDDQFFLARVWNRVNGVWKEIQTTHSTEVLDPLTPTFQLAVGDGTLNVKLSDVYVRSGLIKGDVRIDIYTTRGKIDLDLRSYYDTEFEVTYRDFNGITDSAFIEPLRIITDMRYWCAEYIQGGRNALTFTELRDRVIDNKTGSLKKPISAGQLSANMSDLGYTTLKSIDYVTKRIYHASTPMPDTTLSEVSTPIGTMNGILQTSYFDLAKLPTVYNNGDRMTISPNTLYVERDGMIYFADDSLDGFNGLPLVNRIAALNNNRYLHTPFYYVLDVNSDVFEARPYHLSDPKISGKRFVDTNATMQLDVGVGSYSIELHPEGYQLLLVTRSTDVYQTLPEAMCGCQISYVPRGYTTQVAYLNGEFVGWKDQERVFRFIIKTNMDLDRNHDIIVSNFIMGQDDPNPMALMLDVEMNVIFYTSGYTIDGYSKIDADAIVHDTAPGGNIMAITHETMQFNLGKYLKTLWANARTIASPMEYVRYDKDVYATYTKDVYEIDATTKLPVIITGSGGVKSLKYIHRVGDTILVNGKPMVLHNAGDVMYVDGQPVLKEPRKLQRRVELFLFDARYSVANTDEVKTYYNTVLNFILKGVLEDLPTAAAELLEQTEMFYYPINTLGYVDVRLGDNSLANMDAELSFNVTYYVTDAVRKNTALLKALTSMTRSTIAEYLKNRTCTVAGIVSALREKAGDDIIDVEMEKIGDNRDQSIMTLRRDNDCFTLGKKVAATPDGSITIRDDISITYTKHVA